MKIHGLGLIQRPELLRSQEKGTGADRARTEIGAETVELSDTARFTREIRDQFPQLRQSARHQHLPVAGPILESNVVVGTGNAYAGRVQSVRTLQHALRACRALAPAKGQQGVASLGEPFSSIREVYLHTERAALLSGAGD